MNEKEVIKSIREGDTALFSKIVERYERMVFRIAMGYLHHKEDAEDATQEIFIKLFRSLSSFKGDSELSTWIYRTTVNHCLDTIEKKNRFSALFRFAEEVSEKLFGVSDNTKAADAQMIEQQEEERIEKLLNSLPSNQKTAFVLSRYEELPQKEIAEIMQLSEGSVEQLLQRAKKNIRKFYDPA